MYSLLKKSCRMYYDSHIIRFSFHLCTVQRFVGKWRKKIEERTTGGEY